MPRAIKGALVKCDPSIRALILKIDAESHDIVIEELDDTHLVVDQNRIPFVKAELARILAQNSYNPLDEEEG